MTETLEEVVFFPTSHPGLILESSRLSILDVKSIGDCSTDILPVFLPDSLTLVIGIYGPSYHPFGIDQMKDDFAIATITDIIDFVCTNFSKTGNLRAVVCRDLNDPRKSSGLVFSCKADALC